jgi:hypothetical protein
MIFRLALKSLLMHPIRALVLGVGFGLGVGVMATLLGVGEVVLEQAKEPALIGGGDVVATDVAGAVTSARFVLASIGAGGTASPRKRADLFLMRPGKDPLLIQARGGIPSLERALGDPETSHQPAWQDAPGDAAWSSPKHEDVLRAMDRFHQVPDVPARASSWAEWLYFKGPNFYCTFLVGPKNTNGSRIAGVRLQLDRGGRVTSLGETAELDEAALLASAPDLTIGNSRVRLEGWRYHITLNLPEASGDFFIDALPGRQLAPLVIRGAGGWVSGYTVPVMSGPLGGWIQVRGDRVALDGTGYHDHNWGFWQGVSWRWGQVQHEGLSYVYGRVSPPADAADPERIPGVLIALGPDGPLGYSTRVAIRETDDPATGRPQRIVVSSEGGSLDLTMDITVRDTIVTPGGVLAKGPDFLQLRGSYHVTGKAGGQAVDFTALGAAETFRGR